MTFGRFTSTTCYTYLVFCEEGDTVYVKVGLSENPLKRLTAICNGVPFKPTRLAYLAMGSRERAAGLEVSILGYCSHWKAAGEWLKLPGAATQDLLTIVAVQTRRYAGGGLKLVWIQVDVPEYRRQQVQKRRHVRRTLQMGVQKFGPSFREVMRRN